MLDASNFSNILPIDRSGSTMARSKGSHSYGVCQTAAAKFERLLHKVVVEYCVKYSVSYDSDIRYESTGAPFNKLTLGQLLDCLGRMDRLLKQRGKVLSRTINLPG